jgi:ribosomal protein S13
MARIAGVDLPRNKHANIALTYIYGIGNSRAARILDAAKVDPMKKVSDLGEDEVNRIRQVIDEHQAAHRNRVLSRIPSSPEPAGSRAAHTHQRSHPQRSA